MILQCPKRFLILATGALFSFFLVTAEGAAQKTDILVLRNGDRITGEVKGLGYGLLRYGTDDAGTLEVEWDKVVSLTSVNTFELELVSERKLFGTLGEGSEPGTMMVAGETIQLITIVAITEISQSFWERTAGYLDFGWTLAKANKAHTTSIGAEMRYRGQKVGGAATYSYYKQGQEDSDDKKRTSLTLDLNRFIGTVWAWRLFTEASHNEELSLDLRTFIGTGARRRITKTNRMEASWTAGVVASREQFSDREESTVSAEVMAAADFLAFRLDSPELDLTSGIQTFASLTESDRYRADFNVRAKYEVLDDFFVALTFIFSFDSNPPSDTAAKEDYTSSVSVGWSW